jgi:ketopantoate reductase
MKVQSVAVLGAGHGGCAAAADLGKRGYSVRLHARSPEWLAALRAQGGIEARGIAHGLVPVDLLTTDAAEAVGGADLIMLVVPYLHEDVGYGLVPMAALGRLAGVATPTIDALVQLAGLAVGVDYPREGLTLERLGLAGTSPSELLTLVQEGV